MQATVNKVRKFKYTTEGQYPGLLNTDLRFMVVNAADGTAKVPKTGMNELMLDASLLVNAGAPIAVDSAAIEGTTVRTIPASVAGSFSGFAMGDFVKIELDGAAIQQGGVDKFFKVLGVAASGDSITVDSDVVVPVGAVVTVVQPANTADYAAEFTIDATGDYMLYVESITTGRFDPVEQVIVVAVDDDDLYNELQILKSSLGTIAAAQGVTPGRILA